MTTESTQGFTLSSLLTFTASLAPSLSLSLILTEATLVVGDSRIKLTGFLPSFLISAAET